MTDGTVAWALLLVGGVVAALLLERASAPVLSAPALRRTNYRGHELADGGRDRDRAGRAGRRGGAHGPGRVRGGGGAERQPAALRRAVRLLRVRLPRASSTTCSAPRTTAASAATSRRCAHGRLTTGAMKLFGGGVVAIVLTAAPGEVSGRRLLADAALVALAANLGNLLDRAPGPHDQGRPARLRPDRAGRRDRPGRSGAGAGRRRRRRPAPGRPRRAPDARRHRRQPPGRACSAWPSCSRRAAPSAPASSSSSSCSTWRPSASPSPR